MKNKLIIALLITAVVFSGCSSRKSRFSNLEHLSSDQKVTGLVHQLEAKLYDIPVPFHEEEGRLLSLPETAPENVVLAYTTNLTDEDILNLYHQEMERLGWQEVACFKGDESLITFKKPQRWATVLIRRKAHHLTELVLFTGIKVDPLV